MTFWENVIQLFNIGVFGIISTSTDNAAAASASMVIGVLVPLIAGYLIGSFSPSIYLSKKLYGGDIREEGSGNAGSTNMLRTHGKKAGLYTALGDLAKTVVACLIGYISLGYDGAALAGFAAVLGHVAPVFYKFKGGKGVMVAAGTVLMLDPIVFLVCILLFAMIVFVSKTVSIGSIMTALVYPMIFNRLGGHYGTPMLTAILTMVIVVFMHRKNIMRILNGEESKISIGGKKNKSGEAEEAVSVMAESAEEASKSDETAVKKNNKKSGSKKKGKKH